MSSFQRRRRPSGRPMAVGMLKAEMKREADAKAASRAEALAALRDGSAASSPEPLLVHLLVVSAKCMLAICTLGIYPIVPWLFRSQQRILREQDVRRQMYRQEVWAEARRRREAGGN